jgi:hypothetical protein
MAADLFNSLTGYSVGIPAIEVIDASGNVVSNFLNLTGNVSANKVYANSFFYANGQPFNANPGGSNTQLQFNSNGVLGGIPNVTWNGNILNLGNVANLRIGGGTNGYVLQTDGAGNLTWTAQTGGGGGNGTPGGSNSQVQFNDAGTFGGDAGFTYNKLTNTLSVENITAGNSPDDTVTIAGNLSVTGDLSVNDIASVGNLSASGNVIGEYLVGNGTYITGLVTDIANYVARPIQSNITAVGTLSSLALSGNLTSTANIAISGDYSGANLSLSANITASNGAFRNLVTIGSNLTINNSAVLRIAGNLNSAGSPNIYLGTLANIHITGGVGGQVITTDGTGNLYWGTGGGGNGGSPGGNNQSVQFNSGGDFGGDNTFVYDTGTGRLTVPSIKSNTTANFVGASSVNLGNVANLHISGGLNGYVLQTDGSGNLSWSVGGGGGNGNPGGSNTQVQFNNSENFGGSAYFTYNDYTRTVQVGGNLIANSFQIGAGAYQWSTSLVYFATTASSSPQQLLYNIPVSQISGVEFEIIATEPAGPSRQSCKISALYYDGTVSFTEYASLFVNGGVGNFEVDYDAGNIITPPSLALMVTPSTSNPVTYKMLITQYAP